MILSSDAADDSGEDSEGDSDSVGTSQDTGWIQLGAVLDDECLELVKVSLVTGEHLDCLGYLVFRLSSCSYQPYQRTHSH